MTDAEICEVFERAFESMTFRLVDTKLERRKLRRQEALAARKEGCWEQIHAKGFINVRIVCHFSENLFQYITTTMNGGSAPPQDEIILYLNEYMNIICGCALSELNNVVHKPSRLSVPQFYEDGAQLDLKPDAVVWYDSRAGDLQVYIECCIDKNHQEGETTT